MLPVVGTVVVAPHLVADLNRLFEHLEAFRNGREGHAERTVLALVPGGPDAEHGASAGDDVERGHDLCKEARIPIGDPGDHQRQGDALGLPGHKAERGIALEHRILGGREPLHLKPVVHHREGGAAGLLGSLSILCKGWAERLAPTREGEVHEVEREFHRVSPATVWRAQCREVTHQGRTWWQQASSDGDATTTGRSRRRHRSGLP